LYSITVLTSETVYTTCTIGVVSLVQLSNKKGGDMFSGEKAESGGCELPPH